MENTVRITITCDKSLAAESLRELASEIQSNGADAVSYETAHCYAEVSV